MRNKLTIFLAALSAALLVLLAASRATAQTGGGYDLSWSVIAGGGGTSTGGQYSLSDTIGQPATGVSTGGSYTMFDGFWAYGATVEIPVELSGVIIR